MLKTYQKTNFHKMPTDGQQKADNKPLLIFVVPKIYVEGHYMGSGCFVLMHVNKSLINLRINFLRFTCFPPNKGFKA